MSRAAIHLLWLFALVNAGPALYLIGRSDGREAAQRNCPPAQHGEKLLSTVQHLDGTIWCSYAESGTGYGRAVTRRKAS